LVQVRLAAHAANAGLVQQRLHNGWLVSAEFEAVGSAIRGPAHVGARLLGAVDGTLIPAGSGAHIGEETRCHYLVPRAPARLRDGPVNSVPRTGIAHRGYPVPHPQLVHVLGGRSLTGATDV